MNLIFMFKEGLLYMLKNCLIDMELHMKNLEIQDDINHQPIINFTEKKLGRKNQAKEERERGEGS